MKSFLQKILIGIIVFLFPASIFACALPPDVLHEFQIITSENPVKIRYSLLTWDNLRNPTLQILEQNSQNLKEMLEKHILKNSHFSFNDKEFSLKFLTGQTLENSSSSPDLQNSILTAVFETNISLSDTEMNNFELTFDKSDFLSISPLIHPYLTTDFQKNNFAKYYVLDEKKQIFNVYENGKNSEMAVKSYYTEEDIVNNFLLSFQKKWENFKNPNAQENFWNLASAPKNEKKSENIDFFKPWETLKNFFGKNLSLGFTIFGFVIAVLSGMAHGLLPGHSKSLLVGYVSSGGKISKKEIFTIISSITVSHTLFIFVLAIIIILLQKWTSFSASIISNIWAILYALFGGFFLWKWWQFFFKKEKFWKNFHGNSCACCERKPLKNTIFIGFLAGLVPCVDALALFVLAISIGNIFYSSFLILAFSLGIGIMLGIIALSLNSGKNFLHKKWNQFAEKFSHFLTLLAGLFLIIVGVWHFL